MNEPIIHPAEQYALDVASGKILAGHYIKQAIGRYFHDMENAEEKGLYFDRESAQHSIDFFPRFLVHTKGEWGRKSHSGHRFELEPWQQFVNWNVYGWRRLKDGYRRFRTVFIFVARKNGKTCWLAGQTLYGLFAEGEPEAEVYAAATKRDQAKIVFNQSCSFIRNSPELKQRLQVFKNNICDLTTNSKYEPLGKDADTLDGLNTHVCAIDELHAHKTRDILEVIDSSVGARREPLLFMITTAGVDVVNVCYEEYDYGKRILDGIIEDDSYAPFIYEIDRENKDFGVEEDDPFDETKWIKANPNLGVSIQIEDIRREALKAKEIPSKLHFFECKRVNRWSQSSNSWISMQQWHENYKHDIDESNLEGRLCYGGLDLSSTIDICAWAMLFPNDDDYLDVLVRMWVPEAKINDPGNRFRNEYKAWARDGILLTNPGDAIDYKYITSQIVKDSKKFKIHSINIDRMFQGHSVGTDLENEIGWETDILGLQQGYGAISLPTKQLERLLKDRKLNHGGNPALKWMASNVVVDMNTDEQLKPSRKTSAGKIDGIMAIIFACDRWMRFGKIEDDGDIGVGFIPFS